MAAAFSAATKSTNKIRQVGAVLITGDGRVGWMEHGERHAIFEAARRGLATAGGHLTTTFFPCIDCARAIVDSGIACIDTPAPAFADPVWGPSFERSQIILQ